jgi:hypothetical protein
MHKNPATLQEVRDNLAEAAYTAWIDKSFVPRAIVMVNAMGKTINSVALEIKAAELNKSEVSSLMLPPPQRTIEAKKPGKWKPTSVKINAHDAAADLTPAQSVIQSKQQLMNKQKQRQHGHRKAKRNIQNQRTFENIQKRRLKHAKNHGMKIDDLGATYFVTRPTSKNQWNATFTN